MLTAQSTVVTWVSDKVGGKGLLFLLSVAAQGGSMQLKAKKVVLWDFNSA
jgi:hypothetical protein